MLVPSHAAPPLMLLPGTLCDERLFAPLLARMQQPEHFPALEAHTIVTTNCDSLREAALEVLSQAPPQFALLGFSLGGLVALEVALQAPDRVLGLALLDVNAAPAPPETHARRRQAVEEARATGHGRYLCEQLWPAYVGPASQANLGLQSLLAAMAEELGHEAFRFQTEMALRRRDYRPLLASLLLPTLVLAGEHDAICSAEVQRSFADAIPKAEFVLIRDAGHFALLEQQDAVAASVAAWFHTTVSAHMGPLRPQESM